MRVKKSRIDVEEVDSNFVVAALICVPDAKRVTGGCGGTVHANMPLGFGHRWFL